VSIVLSVVALLVATIWTGIQQGQLNRQGGSIVELQQLVCSLILPLLNETEPFNIIDGGTYSLIANAVSWTVPGPPPSGNSFDANWFGFSTVLPCRLLQYDIGGVIWTATEWDTVSPIVPGLASDATNLLSVQFRECSLTIPGATTLPFGIAPGDIPKLQLTPPFVVNDPAPPSSRQYPFVTSSTSFMNVEFINHADLCGAPNVICNTVPAGTSVFTTGPIRALHFVQTPL